MRVHIYVLRCPDTLAIRYVGKTQDPSSRLYAHISKARTKQVSHYCSDWILSLLRDGKRPILEVVFVVFEKEDWRPCEKEFISLYRHQGCNLTNLTGGGEGFYKANPELIARRAASAKITKSDPVWLEAFSKKLREARNRPDVAEKCKEAVKSAWQDPEKRSSFLAGMNTPEAKARRSAATKARYEGKPRPEKAIERDRKKAQAEINRREQAYWRAKKKVEAELRKAMPRKSPDYEWSDDRRAKQAAAINARREKMNLTPEGRERQKQAMREYWAARREAKALQSAEHPPITQAQQEIPQ